MLVTVPVNHLSDQSYPRRGIGSICFRRGLDMDWLNCAQSLGTFFFCTNAGADLTWMKGKHGQQVSFDVDAF